MLPRVGFFLPFYFKNFEINFIYLCLLYKLIKIKIMNYEELATTTKTVYVWHNHLLTYLVMDSYDIKQLIKLVKRNSISIAEIDERETSIFIDLKKQ